MNTREDILFVIPNLHFGGAERVVCTLINSLQNNNNNVKLLLFENRGELLESLKISKENIYSINSGRTINPLGFINKCLKVRRVVKLHSPSVVISFLTVANIHVLLGTVGCGTKVFCSERISPSFFNQNLKGIERVIHMIYRRLLPYLYNKLSRKLIVQNLRIKQEWIELGVNSDKIDILENPFDLKKIEALSTVKTKNFSENKKKLLKIISIGRIDKQKNYECCIKAASLLSQTKLPFEWKIYGVGPEEDRLKNYVLTQKLTNQIIFCGVIQNPYASIFRSDVFVLSSNFEGFPNVLVEAMSCGCPVIATDCKTGPREIIGNNEFGTLVPVNDERALAKAIEWVYQNKELAKHKAVRAKKQVLNYSVENIKEKLLTIIKT